MREPVVLSLAKMGALLGEVSSGLLLAPQDIDSAKRRDVLLVPSFPGKCGS